MERINYRDLIEKIIREHAIATNPNDTASDRLIFDRDRDSYLLVYF